MCCSRAYTWRCGVSDVQEAREAVERVRQDLRGLDHNERALVLADCDDMLAALDDAEAQRARHEQPSLVGLEPGAWCPADGNDEPCVERQSADRAVARVLAWAGRHGGAA